MKYEEENYEVVLHLDAYAILLNVIYLPALETRMDTLAIQQKFQMKALAPNIPFSPVLRVHFLFHCLQENCHCYWKYILDCLPPIQSVQAELSNQREQDNHNESYLSQSYVSTTIKTILLYYSQQSDHFLPQQAYQMYSLIDYVG